MLTVYGGSYTNDLSGNNLQKAQCKFAIASGPALNRQAGKETPCTKPGGEKRFQRATRNVKQD